MSLYYALIGIQHPRPYVRVYSLNILNTIAKFNAESMVEVTEKVRRLCSDAHWEIKAQCLIFGATMLKHFRSFSGGRGGEDAKGVQRQGSGKPGSQGGAGGNQNKTIQSNIEIVQLCFNTNSPKSVQKLGLFEL